MRHFRSISFALTTKTTLTCKDSKTVDAYAASCKVRRALWLIYLRNRTWSEQRLPLPASQIHCHFLPLILSSFLLLFFSFSIDSLPVYHCRAPPPAIKNDSHLTTSATLTPSSGVLVDEEVPPPASPPPVPLFSPSLFFLLSFSNRQPSGLFLY